MPLIQKTKCSGRSKSRSKSRSSTCRPSSSSWPCIASTTTGPSTTGSCWCCTCSSNFYQNWISKKPEFSGKPEEDAESHLLSTRDWMEAHNFPEGEKVRCFRVTLIGEARLWYESLAPLDNDWPALQNKFRWQYSKIGNTPEQLFHAWRTFKFDKNTDSVDSLCFEDESGCSNAKLWGNADFGEFQKHPSIPTLLNPD